jgi:hypothetical protein
LARNPDKILLTDGGIYSTPSNLRQVGGFGATESRIGIPAGGNMVRQMGSARSLDLDGLANWTGGWRVEAGTRA